NEHLLEIVDIMLNELQETLKEQQLTLEVSQEVKEKLVEMGYHPAFGARPLRRVIQEQLEDGITDYILDYPDQKSLIATMNEDKITIIAK
ncbi:MAG: ATP-dependent Clp protease ATP-binding subunit, partial [Heyndrickxia sp.]